MITKWRNWKESHSDFPLTVHPSGQWSKKIRGNTYYFGILSDPDAARKLWLSEKDYLLAGMAPPTYTTGITVRELSKRHLDDVRDRIAAGKLSHRTKNDYVYLPQLFEKAGILDVTADSLGPTQFAVLQRTIEDTGRSLRSQKNIIIAVKSLFNWGGPDGMDFVKKASYGPRFVAPGRDAIEQQQEDAGRVRFIDREPLLKVIEAATPKLKLAILFGINCAFYPSDSLEITLDHIHLDCEIPFHDFRRVKTKRRRMAVLWPETVEAIKLYIEKFRTPKDQTERTLLLNREHVKYSVLGGSYKLIQQFGNLLDATGCRMKDVNIGSLRHTYATVVDSVADQTMINLTMGHTDKSLQKRIYKQFNIDELERLKVISDQARDWLYTSEPLAKSPC